mmetsp:Transcript_19688/g.52571  ORF Transcript_19688/g.52571 Transcript_19688/m.52571 type:complete len:224 (+) Transcript_19688:1945-2616(+)
MVLVVHDEDCLVHGLASVRLLHGVSDLLEMRVRVSSGRAEQGAGKTVLLCLRKHTCDCAEHGRGAWLSCLVLQQGARHVHVLTPHVTRRAAHGLHRSVQHELLLQRCVAFVDQLCVVLLQLHEVLVYLRHLGFHGVQFVIPFTQEVLDPIRGHHRTRNPGQLISQESQDPLHLVDPLHVLFVRAIHILGVHVVELHGGSGTKLIDKVACTLCGQDQCAATHLL